MGKETEQSYIYNPVPTNEIAEKAESLLQGAQEQITMALLD
jgi:predicted transcriptional regulator